MRSVALLHGLAKGWVLAVLALLSPVGLSGQSHVPDADSDGPHVYWESSSTAIVFYLCDGLFQPQRVLAQGASFLEGFCGDSATEYLLTPRAPEVEPDTFRDVSRIFAVSDIHGEYDALERLLVKAGVVDRDLKWSWGDGHLVILGDVFDRGGRVTECLWLIHRLEREARAAGGRVHYLLGNHEVLVLQGDLRYVNEKYPDGIVRESRIRYDDLFGPAMELGAWLRTKHLAIRLNGVLYVHGGMSPEVVTRNLDIKEINAQGREGIDLRSYDLVFTDLPGFIFGGQGPLWYRGYHRAMEYPQATEEEVQGVLDHFGATAVVVGHTDIGEIQALHGGRVFGIDVDVDTLGSLEGLLWEGGDFFKVRGDGGKELMKRSVQEKGAGS
ncbi:MAG: metallophosphoesterase [Longimicrobiales bacterium]|nr:metallophosphoesterase [Longimicrobiales bacterium]